jgi:ATP-dependent Clp protease ATP-binding subunit ClpC
MDIEDYPFPTGKKTVTKKPKPISRQKFLGLENYLKTSIIGQDPAIDAIVSSLKRSQVGLGDEDRPLGVLLFAGSSGVGKTHLANSLHKYLFGNEHPMVRIDCGEFQHKHENQKLIGSPPGYIGHDEGGQLVNLVKQNPSTVVLLDEVEKAHPDLWNTFLRVFDDGVLTDAKGEIVNFKNTIIIMTTNLGNDKTSDHLLSSGTGFNRDIAYKLGTKSVPNRSIIERNTNDAIKKHFKPEFLNRIDKVVIFNFLSEIDCQKIARIEMSIVIDKLSKKGYQVEYTDEVIEALIEKGIDSIKGARGLSQVRREGIENSIADTLISSAIPKGTTFHIGFEEGSFKFKIEKPQKKLDVSK